MVHVGRLVTSSAVFLAFFCVGHYLNIRDSAWDRLPYGNALRALTDNVIHSLIGGWCWFNAALFIGEGVSTTLLAQVAVCMLMASVIDLDHFVEARSFSLKDAQNLQHRPFLHNTTLVLVFTLVLCLVQWAFSSSFRGTPFFPAMFFLSAISHHLRDATRRGIWLAPFGSTPAVPWKLCAIMVLMISLLPGTIHNLKTYHLARLLSRTQHTGAILSA